MTDEQTLEQLERRWVEALGAGDVQTLSEIWGSDFVFTDPHGQSISRDQCLAAIGSGQFSFTHSEVRSLHVRIFGDTGVVLAVVNLAGHAGSRTYNGDLSIVDVYRKTAEGWRAVLSSGEHVPSISRVP